MEGYLQKNPKKHLIFDFDETLGTLILPWMTLNKKLNEVFIKIDPEIAVRCNNFNWNGYNEMVEKHGLKVKKMIDLYYADFETKNLKGLRPNNDLIKFVKNNHSEYLFYVWSNNQRQTIVKALNDLKINTYFNKIITASDVPLYKPNPAGFNLIYDSNTSKDEYLMIGDSEGDKKAAKNAGIDFLLYSN